MNREMLKREHNSKASKEQARLYTEFETVRYWLEGLGESSAAQYLRYFPKVMEYIKEATGTESPDQVIEARKEDLRSEDPKVQRRFEHIFKTWYHKLYDEFEKEGKSTGSAWNYMRTAMSFFSRNHYPLRYRKGSLKRVKRKIKGIEMDIEDLRTAYGMIENIRDRALFATLLQSGLSPVDVCELNWELLVESGELKEAPLHIQGYREKTTSRYQTCIGYDAMVELKRLWILNDQPVKGAIFESVRGNRMTSRFVNEALTPTLKKVIPQFQVKMLRDVYHDALERANLPRDILDRMFGHEIGGARGEYWFSHFTIQEAYEKAFPFLSVDGVRRRQSSDVAMKELVIRLGQIIAMQNPRQGLLELIEDIRGKEAVKEAETHEDLSVSVGYALRTYLEALTTTE